MFKWFAKKIRDAIREMDYENEYPSEKRVGSGMGSECVSARSSTDERITLRLEKAIGGHIVSVSKYNSRSDRHSENTYLIREDDNLEEALTAVFIQEKMSQ